MQPTLSLINTLEPYNFIFCDDIFLCEYLWGFGEQKTKIKHILLKADVIGVHFTILFCIWAWLSVHPDLVASACKNFEPNNLDILTPGLKNGLNQNFLMWKWLDVVIS